MLGSVACRVCPYRLLQRPDKKNALTGEMYNAMSNAIEKAEADSSVRVVLLQGDGDSFTAGNDLSDFARRSHGESSDESPAQRFISTIGKARKPLIAAVQGNAVGVGRTMLLHCDLFTSLAFVWRSMILARGIRQCR